MTVHLWWIWLSLPIPLQLLLLPTLTRPLYACYACHCYCYCYCRPALTLLLARCSQGNYAIRLVSGTSVSTLAGGQGAGNADGLSSGASFNAPQVRCGSATSMFVC